MIRRRVFEAQRPGAATGLVRIRGGPALTTEADVPGVMILFAWGHYAQERAVTELVRRLHGSSCRSASCGGEAKGTGRSRAHDVGV
jgi:hypothetical protein